MDLKRLNVFKGTIALPTGKSLEVRTLELLEQARIRIERAQPRSCEARVFGCPGISRAVFYRPDEIGGVVSDRADFGITGSDTIVENGFSVKVKVVAKLPYSRTTNGGTSCVLFTRADNPVYDIKSFRESLRTNEARIISEYPRATEVFLKESCIQAKVEPCKGSAETFVATGGYDYGIALVETGTTLAANGLKEIETIFQSSTVLIANKAVCEDGAGLAAVEFLSCLLRSVCDARKSIYLVMNAPKTSVKEITKILPALTSPEVRPLVKRGFYSIASVVPLDDVTNEMIYELMQRGATGIITKPLSSVTP